MALNVVAIVANLTKDPELKYTANGTAVCNLRLASNRKYKSDGDWKEDTCFFTAVVWGKRAENCNQYLKKGSPVFIEGRLASRSWEGSDGKKQYAIDVVVENIQFLDRTKEGTSPEENQGWPESEVVTASDN